MLVYSNVEPIWDESYKEFNYIAQPLMEEEISNWKSKGYYHDSFAGYMYDSRNTMPEWVSIVAEKIGLTNCGFVFYKMLTLDIMPPHKDHFNTYTKLFNVNRPDVLRALIFLEDWKPGHYFEANNTGLTNWKSGDYVLWSADVPHAASNIGTEPRYTLQITGTKK